MRSLNMQALTADVGVRLPGVVIYGVGDEAHQLSPSDHNEDDTPGSKPAQSDSDNNPEHRALDIMVGPSMSKAQCQSLVDDLVADPDARKRLYYIIFDGWIWSRSNNWVKKPHTNDPHRDHAHVSGWAADDENAAHWPAVTKNGGDDTMFCAKNDVGDKPLDLQIKLVDMGYWIGPPDATDRSQPYNYCDGQYGGWTARALAEALGNPNNNGENYGPWEHRALDLLYTKKFGGGGAKGDPGEPGKDGVDGKTPTKVKVLLEADVVEVA